MQMTATTRSYIAQPLHKKKKVMFKSGRLVIQFGTLGEHLVNTWGTVKRAHLPSYDTYLLLLHWLSQKTVSPFHPPQHSTCIHQILLPKYLTMLRFLGFSRCPGKQIFPVHIFLFLPKKCKLLSGNRSKISIKKTVIQIKG